MAKNTNEIKGFEKCYDAYGNIDYNKLGKFYLSLFSKELNSAKLNNEKLVERINFTEDYDSLISSGEEKIITSIVNKIEEKYHFNAYLSEKGIHHIKPYELLGYNSATDINNAINSNLGIDDVINIATNRLSYYSKFKSAFAADIEDTASEINRRDELSLLLGSLKELENYQKSKSLLDKILHPFKTQEDNKKINEVKDQYIRHILDLRSEEKITKFMRGYVEDNVKALSGDYNRVNHKYYNYHINFRRLFPLKTFREEYKPHQIETDEQREARLDPSKNAIDKAQSEMILNEMFKEFDVNIQTNKANYRKPIEAIEVKNDNSNNIVINEDLDKQLVNDKQINK